MIRPHVSAAVLLVFVLAGAAGAQQRELTLDDVLRRAPQLSPRGMAGLAWCPDGKSFSYLERAPGGLAWMRALADGSAKAPIVIEAELAAAAKAAKIDDLPFPALLAAQWRDDGRAAFVFDGERLLLLTLDPQLALREILSIPAATQAQALNAERTFCAYVQDWNVFVRRPDGRTQQVTEGGYRDLKHGLSVSREEFGIKDGLWWDPTGRRLAFYREDLRPVDAYPYVDFKTTPAQAKPGRYPMAGRKGSVVSVGIYDTRDDSVLWLATDPAVDEYLTNVTFDLEGERVFVAHVNRAQNAMSLRAYSAKDGKALATLIEERDEQWIEPESGPIAIPKGKGDFLWFSYRDGFRHLYRHAADGHLLQQLTRGPFDVSAFKGFTKDGSAFYCEASGVDPRQKHLFRCALEAPAAVIGAGGAPDATVEIKDNAMRQLTQGRGQHDAQPSPDGQAILDRHSNVELPLAVDLLDQNGVPVRRVFLAQNPLDGVQMPKQELFTIKAADGSDLHGHAFYPPDMAEGQTYPVLLYVYGGPHAQLVIDSWMLGPGARNLWLAWMATQGFIVARLDNHGTPNRGIEHAQTIHRRLGTVEVADQIAGLDFLIAERQGDKDRVGVHGWSYGGFMTLSLMTRAGERFRCGVSGAPVTDWKFYETGYGERYMDTPEENPEGYEESAIATHVRGLAGKLLLVQGTSDDTVVWQHTIDFVDHCVAAGVDFDYFVYPGHLHGITPPASDHFFRKMTKFFRTELGAAPSPKK
jgi:dipeptidyl-peptidase 4